MRALMYADFCVARTYVTQYLLIGLIVSACSLIGVMGEGGIIPDGASLVAAGSCFLVMVCYFMLYAFFGADEAGNWQEGRLASLPVAPAQVVRARFALMVIVCAGALALAVPVGALVMLGITAVKGQVVVPAVDLGTIGALVAVAGVALVVSAAQMTALFAVGMQRGRAVVFLPFVLIMLLAIPGVEGTLGRAVATATQALANVPAAALATTLVALAAATYLACMRLAQTLYARREL